MSEEADAVLRRRGKWSKNDVPHKGWECVDHYDAFERLGDDEHLICEMCESMQIRFIHQMRHAEYPQELQCGCVCAAHMSENRRGAERREKDMRSRAQRRAHFPDRTGWRGSARGTPYIRVDYYHLMVVRTPEGFVVGVTPPGAKGPTWGKRRYQTLRHAQFGCFDALEFMQEKRRSGK